MEMINWESLAVTILGSGSILYLLLDKLVLSKKEKVDAVSAQSSALEQTISQMQDHNEHLHEHIKLIREDLIHEQVRYDKLVTEYHKLNDECGSVKSELAETKEKLRYYEERHCLVRNCFQRKPPSDVMNDDFGGVVNDDNNSN